jgi:antitoxin component of RelBE/YafQ-DinJ toxin-antitoxin module
MRIDAKLKERLVKFADEVNLPISQVVTNSINHTLDKGYVTFGSPNWPSRPMTKQEAKIIGQIEKERRNGTLETAGPFDSIDEMFASLES